MGKIASIQRILGVKEDEIWGPGTQAALDRAIQLHGFRAVVGTSFADPADVASFKRCKATGKTDKQCFAVGDNGIGCWGDDTTADRPMCALPPEDWEQFGSKARGKLVVVRMGTKEVVCELRDTMPRRKNIKNGAGIDLNPAACARLGLKPPVRRAVAWRWD